MKPHELLGQLSVLHQMMAHLMESIPEADAYTSYHPALPPLAWLYGRAAYLETYWLREVVLGDGDLSARVRPLFGHDVQADGVMAQLPPRDHLLNWALELQEHNLTLLANPSLLPAHPLVREERLLPLIVQQEAVLCEQMLAQLSERGLSEQYDYRVSAPLQALPPSAEHADVQQGHYRIGAKPDDPTARDNELPTQVVELHAFRIDRHPIRNGAWLGFMNDGGYDRQELWSEAGWQWRQQHTPHPHHWRRDDAGHWYGVGLNGPFDLVAEDAVSGIGLHEALAYANWAATQGELFAGAVLQHEYQWEIAARTEAISDYGRVWEWCANPFHSYTGYAAPEQAEAADSDYDGNHHALRGGSLHTQRIQRRTSYRNHAAPDQRCFFSGARLVFPPSKMPWHK